MNLQKKKKKKKKKNDKAKKDPRFGRLEHETDETFARNEEGEEKRGATSRQIESTRVDTRIDLRRKQRSSRRRGSAKEESADGGRRWETLSRGSSEKSCKGEGGREKKLDRRDSARGFDGFYRWL